MDKNEIRGYIVDAIAFIVFSVIAFVAPFSKTGSFWLGYVFGVIAIAYQIYVFKISFRKGGDAKSKFYGFPIAKIGVVYLLAQLTVSLVEMIGSKGLPAWIATIINVILLAIALVGCITADVMRDEIERQDIKIKTDVGNMRALQSMTASFIGMCQAVDTKQQLQDLADEFKYSDPVSSEATKELEVNLKDMVSEIQSALIDGDMLTVNSLIIKVKVTLAERNRVCKLGK